MIYDQKALTKILSPLRIFFDELNKSVKIQDLIKLRKKYPLEIISYYSSGTTKKGTIDMNYLVDIFMAMFGLDESTNKNAKRVIESMVDKMSIKEYNLITDKFIKKWLNHMQAINDIGEYIKDPKNFEIKKYQRIKIEDVVNIVIELIKKEKHYPTIIKVCEYAKISQARKIKKIMENVNYQKLFMENLIKLLKNTMKGKKIKTIKNKKNK